jgi:hypothetical protein
MFAQLAVPVVVGAEDAEPPASACAAVLEQASDLLKDAEYEEVISLLNEHIGKTETQADPDCLKDSYLLLIKTYTMRGNFYQFEDRATATLYHKEARAKIRECLETPGLNHTRPEPAYEYPRETTAFFAEVRSEIFGSFRLVELDPPDASVVFGGDTLAVDTSGVIQLSDLPVGHYTVVVEREGYRPLVDEVEIAANSTLAREYVLEEEVPLYRRPLVYGVAAAAVGIVAAVAAVGGGGGSEPEPLPEPPPPP